MTPIQLKPPGSNPSDNVLSAVRRTISEFSMIAPRDTILVAVSGGIDSVVLLNVLFELAPGLSIRLGVAHLHHGLRGKDADKDADFVAALSSRLELPFHGHQEDTRSYQRRHRISQEEAARRLRYAFFDSVCTDHGYGKVATGHHADDNAELILMQLFRGAGLASLAGIPPIRDAKIIRPLIRLTRLQIQEYANAAGFSYMNDNSNLDRRHLRNRIRCDLIPVLQKEYNPAVVQSLNRLSDIVRDELLWTEELCEAQSSLAVTSMETGRLQLSLDTLRHSKTALRRRIIRKAIERVKGDLRQIAFAHVESILQLMDFGADGGCLHLPGRIKVQITGGELTLTKHDANLRSASRPAAAQHRFRLTVRAPSTEPLTVFVREAGVRVVFSSFATDVPGQIQGAGQQQAFFDMDKLRFPLVLRNVELGDRFSPLGAGGTQKVKKFFIDHKVPQKQRIRCPLLVSGKQIVWVVGHRIAEAAKVTTATTLVLKAEVQVV